MRRAVNSCRATVRPSTSCAFRYRLCSNLALLWVSAGLAIFCSRGHAMDAHIIARLHSDPPSPCIAKSIDDRSSLIAIKPTGTTREEVIAHMAAMAGIFLVSGRAHMTAEHISAVYTAVFYQDEPINEVGVYAYRFRDEIDAQMFAPAPQFHGRFFAKGRMLVLVWHEDIEKTGSCYAAVAGYFVDNF